MLVDHDSDVPLYQQLAVLLMAAIDSGEIPPRRPIPSKKTLTQLHGVAPGTVEHALDVLREAGMIRPVLGKGLYVVPAEERPR